MRAQRYTRCRRLLLPLVLVLCATGARAGEGSGAGTPANESSPETAKQHARKGSAFYNLGEYKQAVTEFEAAYQVLPVPALLFNIAQCYRQLEDLPMAARLYQSFLRTNPSEAAAKQARELLDKVESDLQHRKATVASPPLELSLPAAGTGTVPAAEKGRGAPPPAKVAAAPAAARSPAAPPAALRATPPATAAAQHHRWPAVALGAVGLAALAGGVVEGLGSSSASSQLSTLHQQNAVVDPAQDAMLRSQASSKHIRARNLYLASVAAFAVGAGLFFVF